jgi:hypothetical protein
VNKALCGLSLLCCFPGGLASASEGPLEVNMSVYHITGMLEHGRDDLPYSKLLQHLAQKSPIEMDYKIYHGLRAATLFNTGISDCLFPGTNRQHQQETFLESVPANVAKAYFFADKLISTEHILTSAQPRLKIGFYRGNSFGGNIDKLKHHELTPLNSGADVRSLLERKRIDVFLNYMPDAIIIVDVPGKAPLQYGETSLFYAQNDSFICHDKPVTRALIGNLNAEIEKFKRNIAYKRALQFVKPKKAVGKGRAIHSEK